MSRDTDVFFKRYGEFVDGVTSDASKDNKALIARIEDLDAQGIDVARLLTGAVGCASEGGELLDIVKKVVFHGKELEPAVVGALKSELGDVQWYAMQVCLALGFSPANIFEQNVEKLKLRYPGGKFDIWHSENRDVVEE